MRGPRSFICALALVLCVSFEGTARASETPPAEQAPPRDDALAYFENLPDTNPYRAALLRYQTLPAADREALKAWADARGGEEPIPILSPEQASLAAELSSSIMAAGSAPATVRADWPLLPNPDDPDNPSAITFPGAGTLRTLARLTAAEASALPADQACAAYAAVAQLGRQQRSGATLIEQLNGVAIEGIAQAEVAKRLGELDAEGLARLSSRWSALKPPPSNAQAMAGERDEFFLPVLERVLVPGLHALLKDPQAGLAPDAPSGDAGFTRDLRLSGLIALGEGKHRVVLENTRNGESLSLELGQEAGGIALVSLDYDKRVAVLRRGNQEAIVHLESKRIVEQKNPAKALRDMFKSFDLLKGAGSGEQALGNVLDRARRHPEGVDGYLLDLRAAYQSGIDRQLQLAESPRAPEESEAAPTDADPLLSLSMPMIGRLARTLNCVSAQTVMLQAAIQHRLGELNQPADPYPNTDPWGVKKSDGFSRESTPDGGFILRSRYEFSPGQPLTYKFAAPDAGFIRKK